MKVQLYVLCGAALAFGGCMDQGQKGNNGSNQEQTGQTGMAIASAVDTTQGTDVALIEYQIDRIACEAGEKFDALSRRISVRLEDMLLPGGVSAWENSPLDKGSKHPFADHFEVLPAGCYDVVATPEAADQALSKDCAAAFSNGVQVNDGLTTEVFLISQCKGSPVGALDSVIALNKPPQLTQLTFTPSKFITQGQKTTVCATATDANNDPLQFAWVQLGGAMCGATVISNQNQNGGTTECVDIEPMKAGSYEFEVQIYDLVHDQSGALIRIEDWLKQHGYPNTSHASLRFPVYVGAPASGM